MSLSLRPQEAAFETSLDTLSPAQLAPELRRVLAAARPLPYYVGSAALAYLTYEVACKLTNRGVPVEALPLFREALAELTATLGADHQLTAKAASTLGFCLYRLGQNEEALPLLERACLMQLMGVDKKPAPPWAIWPACGVCWATWTAQRRFCDRGRQLCRAWLSPLVLRQMHRRLGC